MLESVISVFLVFLVSLKLEFELFLRIPSAQHNREKNSCRWILVIVELHAVETSSRPSSLLHAGMETSSNGEMRMKNSPTMHLTSNHLHHNTSSPENSPRSDRMDTSTTTMELNGKPDSRSSSQQFCLRWNNHQVSVQVAQKTKLIFGSFTAVMRAYANSFFFCKSMHNTNSDPDFFSLSLSREICTVQRRRIQVSRLTRNGLTELLAQKKKKNSRKKKVERVRRSRWEWFFLEGQQKRLEKSKKLSGSGATKKSRTSRSWDETLLTFFQK